MKNKEKYFQLLQIAKEFSKKSYSPYSRFKVGAAVLCEDDKVFGGTNIENVSYGLSMCAERVAIFSAITNGAKKIKAVAIYTSNGDTTPCGACRQVIAEFSNSVDIIYNTKNNSIKVEKNSSLLPKSFNKKSIKRNRG